MNENGPGEGWGEGLVWGDDIDIFGQVSKSATAASLQHPSSEGSPPGEEGHPEQASGALEGRMTA